MPCRGATNAFAGPFVYNTTTNTPFTNNLLLTAQTGGDGGAICVVSTNGVAALVLTDGQTTTIGMPSGLTLKFIDFNSQGKSSFTNVYCQVYGIPNKIGTNTFNLALFYAVGTAGITNDFTIGVTGGSSSSPPSITSQPVSLTNNVGSNATFSVTNGGTAPLHYQWFFNTNTAQLNATNTSFTVTNVQLTNAGTYSVIITNSSGSVTSSFARLTVWQPPIVTNPPVSIINLAGSSPAFSVTAGGVPAVGYQWKFNTNTVLTGFTGTALTLTNARASQAGTYSVVITNSAGSVTNFASLMVTNPVPAAFTPTAPVKSATGFQFTFTTVAGLTNTVLTNGLLVGGVWNVFTNIPPTPTPTPIVISNVLGTGNLFYRVQVVP